MHIRKHPHLHFRNPSALWWGQSAEMDKFLLLEKATFSRHCYKKKSFSPGFRSDPLPPLYCYFVTLNGKTSLPKEEKKKRERLRGQTRALTFDWRVKGRREGGWKEEFQKRYLERQRKESTKKKKWLKIFLKGRGKKRKVYKMILSLSCLVTLRKKRVGMGKGKR